MRGAESPSISADGRYVAFDTAQQLVPQDTNENYDVYVRDMTVPLSAERKSSGAYTLVSAQNGSEEPPIYDDSSITPIPGGEPGAEAVAEHRDQRRWALRALFRSAEVPSSLPEGVTPTGNAAGSAIRTRSRRQKRPRWSAFARKKANSKKAAGRRCDRPGHDRAPTARPSPGWVGMRPNRLCSWRARIWTKPFPTIYGVAGRNRAPRPGV